MMGIEVGRNSSYTDLSNPSSRVTGRRQLDGAKEVEMIKGKTIMISIIVLLAVVAILVAIALYDHFKSK